MMPSQKIRLLFLTVLGALGPQLLTGCATLDKEECLNAEWYAIGYEDGVKGRSQGRLGDHRKACAEYGVSPDLERYIRGYEDGLAKFCLPRNGYRAGVAGRNIQVTCPAELSGEFNEAYRYGKQIYVVERESRRHRHTIDKKNKELKQIRQEIQQVEEKLVHGHSSGNRSAGSLRKSRALIKREVELEMAIAELQDDEAEESPGREHPDNRGSKQGKKLGHDKKRVKALERKTRELERVRHDIARLEEAMHKDDSVQHERRRLLQESHRLRREAGQLGAELSILERKNKALRSQVRALNRHSPY